MSSVHRRDIHGGLCLVPPDAVPAPLTVPTTLLTHLQAPALVHESCTGACPAPPGWGISDAPLPCSLGPVLSRVQVGTESRAPLFLLLAWTDGSGRCPGHGTNTGAMVRSLRKVPSQKPHPKSDNTPKVAKKVPTSCLSQEARILFHLQEALSTSQLCMCTRRSH